MILEIIARNQITATPGIKERINSQLSSAEKFLSEDARVIASIRISGNDQIIEVTIPNFIGETVRVEERAHDLYAAIDKVEDKLVRVLRKKKERIRDAHRKAKNHEIEANTTDNSYSPEAINRVKEIVSILKDRVECLCETINHVKEIDVNDAIESVDEAIARLEKLDHDFHLFIDTDTNSPSVVYRQKNGGYGLLRFRAGILGYLYPK